MSKIGMSKIATSKIAMVAAMEREVRPLIRNWKVRTIEHSGRRYRIFEDRKTTTTLTCSRIGFEAARRATEALIEEVHPTRVISIGFAGALNVAMQVGDVLEPHTVINAADGVRTEVGGGAGTLVSSATVAGKDQKARLAKAYSASAVDMEAAAVAQGARAHGIDFAALKAISDNSDFDLPAMDGFVGADGTFRSVRFAFHVALRPLLWRSTIELARNSSRASHALCEALARYLEREIFPAESLAERFNQTQLNQTELLRTEADSEFASAHTSGATQFDTQTERK
jgi:adenosylhomocysteine nucleosidase